MHKPNHNVLQEERGSVQILIWKYKYVWNPDKSSCSLLMQYQL